MCLKIKVCYVFVCIFFQICQNANFYYMCFVGNLLGFPAMEKFWKSVQKWQSYCHEFGVQFFLAHSVVLEVGRNLRISCTTDMYTLFENYLQERRNVKEKIVAFVLSTDHRPLRLATNVCPRARAQQAFIWRLDHSTCWRSCADVRRRSGKSRPPVLVT